MRVPRGGASCLGVGRSGSGVLPPPSTWPFGRAARGPLPTGCGCGGCGRGDPSPTPQRALLQAGFVRCGGGRGRPGGRLLPGRGASGDGRSPTPNHPSFRACGRGPLPTGCGCGGCGRGDPSPTPQQALLQAGFARCGGGRGCPGGAPLAWVWGVRGRAFSHPQPPVLSGVRPGPTTHWLWVRGVRAWGPVTNPTARALASWLCALWGRQRAPGGAPLAWAWGVRGRALSHPQPPVLSGVRPGPTAHWLWVRGMRSWGPVTNPTAGALASWLCALWGRQRVPRGGASCLGVGRSGSGVLPPPTTRPFGRAAGAHYPLAVGAGGAGVGARHQPHSARSCKLALRALGAAEGARGGASCLGVGRPGTGALPAPTTRPFGRAAGARFPLAAGAVCGRGGPADLGTLSCAAVRRVLCALPGFAALGGPCGLAPVLVPWLWPAACLTGVPRGPALVRRSSSGPVALGAPVGFPVAMVPSPTPGAVAPALLGGCAGHVEAGREPGSLCLPLAPAEARALGALSVVSARGPAMGLSLAGPSGFGLGLRALRWFGVCGPGH